MPQAMTTPQEATVEVSFPKILALSALSMVAFVVGCYTIGIPIYEPIFIAFMCVITVVMTPVFAAFTYFSLRCRIGYDGLRPSVPTFYERLIRWSDITAVHRIIGSPSYAVRGRGMSDFALLPTRFLLKRPDSLRQLIEQYAPADNIVRKTLAA